MKNNFGMSLLLVLMMVLTLAGVLYVCLGSIDSDTLFALTHSD